VDELNNFQISFGPEAKGSVWKFCQIEMLKFAMIKHGVNQRKAAEELGLPKSTLNDKLLKFGIDPKEFKEATNEPI
jgi:DNA-binding NtrC family response regulator